MRILFIGESWLGSSARGVGEALARQPGIQMEDIGTDRFIPNFRDKALRMANKFLISREIAALKNEIERAARDMRPDVIVVVKGWELDAQFVRKLRRTYAPAVNIFTDASPHVHGQRLKDAVGEYDLVIARNKYHPPLWKSVYGYDNPCVHVTHAYIPGLHQRDEPARDHEFDIAMVATGRQEYESLVKGLCDRIKGRGLRFVIGGNGWEGRGLDNIPGLSFVGVKPGMAYADWLRKGKIVIAPVQTILHSDGVQQPGDETTGRTFQCASAYTFFIHKRTPEVQHYYDENTEVPMYDDASELADKIDFYLAHDDQRLRMAAAAHRRAVPAYSYDARAAEIVHHLRQLVGRVSPVSPPAVRT